MPNLVPVTLNHGDASDTFEPVSLKDGLGVLICDGVSPSLSKTLTASTTRPSKTSRLKKSRMRIVLPYPKVVGGVATDVKGREASVDIVFTTDESAPSTDRADLLAFLNSALTNGTVKEVVVDGKSFY